MNIKPEKLNIKPISIIATILLLVFAMTMISPSTINVKASDSYITPLIAGQYMTIGYVETWYEDISGALILHVKYVIDDTAWYLTEVHLAVSTSLTGIPRTKTGNPIPGLFPYSATGLWTQEYEFTINLTDVFGLTCPASDQTTIYIAAHADVAKVDEYGNTVQTETAWASGTRFTTRGNWGMYFTYNIICEQYVSEECYLSGNAETAWANGYDFPGKKLGNICCIQWWKPIDNLATRPIRIRRRCIHLERRSLSSSENSNEARIRPHPTTHTCCNKPERYTTSQR